MDILQEKGLVTKIEQIYKEGSTGSDEAQQVIKVKILSGADEGEVVSIMDDSYENPFHIDVDEGDEVFLYAQSDNGVVQQYSIQDHWHMDGVIGWGITFLLLVIIVGGRAGLKAIFSLCGSVALIFAVFLPLIIKGYAPMPLVVGISALIIFFTHAVIAGFSKKSLAAMVGTFGGVIVATGLVYLMGWSISVNGLGTEVSRVIAVNDYGLNIREVLYAGIVLGALGAVMDVSISIASGLSEIKKHKPNISQKALMKSGFNIGKDILGSMLNTLIFAYIGSAMMAIVLFMILQTSVVELLNFGFIAEEIMRSLVGSLGLLATIPLTAVVSAMIMSGKK